MIPHDSSPCFCDLDYNQLVKSVHTLKISTSNSRIESWTMLASVELAVMTFALLTRLTDHAAEKVWALACKPLFHSCI